MATFNPYVYNKALLRDFSYFTMSEFRCGCRRCRNHAFPTHINAKLLTYLEQLRLHFGKPVIITSGLRCSKYNKSLPGSSKNSRHISGMAADIFIKDVSPSDICKYWKSLNVGYCYYGTPNMGNAAHVQIGW
jgi:zinc D-Ala-D-Ala carboxypeptidase